jgi:hypothetical protein
MVLKYVKVFIGKSPRNKMTEFSGAYGPAFDGNTILVKVAPLKYVWIGQSIEEFRALDEIVFYVSPVGNSDVPYAWARDTKNRGYIFREKVIITNMPKNTSPDDYYYDVILSKKMDIRCLTTRESYKYGKNHNFYNIPFHSNSHRVVYKDGRVTKYPGLDKLDKAFLKHHGLERISGYRTTTYRQSRNVLSSLNVKVRLPQITTFGTFRVFPLEHSKANQSSNGYSYLIADDITGSNPIYFVFDTDAEITKVKKSTELNRWAVDKRGTVYLLNKDFQVKIKNAAGANPYDTISRLESDVAYIERDIEYEYPISKMVYANIVYRNGVHLTKSDLCKLDQAFEQREGIQRLNTKTLQPRLE